MDVLTDLLERSRARGAAFSHSTAHGDWGVSFPTTAGLAVHCVVDGDVHLWTDDPARSARLLPGDIVLVRGGVPHRLAGAPGAACVTLAEVIAGGPLPGTSRRFAIGDPGAGHPDERPSVFCCGAYLFDGDLADGILDALPDVVRLRPAPGSALRATVDLLAREMERDEPGQQTALDRLLDVALVHALRQHFTDDDAAAPTWFRALADPHVGGALRALHGDPGRAWTVADLAAEASLSRAAFARRFTAVLGVTPLAYLSGWRMALARERLREGDEGLAAIAASLGYASEFSFSAAFKRHHGTAPGRWRTQRAAASGSQAAA